MEQHCVVKLQIKNNQTISVSIITDDNEIIPITLNNNQLECPMFITFKDFSYSIGQDDEKGNRIYFLQDLFTESSLYKYYEITFHQKDYKLIAEVLIGLIMNEFKKKIEQKYIIDESFVEIETEDPDVIGRISIAIEAIGMKNEVEYQADYQEYIEQ